ncbi:MAG: hypothetical protein ACI8RZ_006688 [Myxococcota bacterium]|jgi:hypothetical protein
MLVVVLEHAQYHSPLPPDALRAALSAIVEPTPWPPRLIFKLSGGGIVSRVMESPQTTLPFFGLVSAEKIRIARASYGGPVTPYQPILLATLSAAGEGSLLELTLRPHRETKSLSGLFAVAGFVLLGASIPALLDAQALGVVAVVIGALFMVFPTWRARTCFRSDHQDALSTLCAALPLSEDSKEHAL